MSDAFHLRPDLLSILILASAALACDARGSRGSEGGTVGSAGPGGTDGSGESGGASGANGTGGLVGTGGAVGAGGSPGRGGSGGSGGTGGAGSSSFCSADFPCDVDYQRPLFTVEYRYYTCSAGDRDYVIWMTFSCSSVCPPGPCSGGSCKQVGTGVCPEGSSCNIGGARQGPPGNLPGLPCWPSPSDGGAAEAGADAGALDAPARDNGVDSATGS